MLLIDRIDRARVLIPSRWHNDIIKPYRASEYSHYTSEFRGIGTNDGIAYAAAFASQ